MGRIVRFIVIFLINALGVFIISKILPGIRIDSFGAAIILSIFIAVLNAIIFPLYSRFALPLTVLTLGLGTLIINAIIIMLFQ